MRTVSYGVSDPGKTRPRNEDAYLRNDALGLYAVADGVGGHAGGEIASRIAVDTLGETMPDFLGDKDRTPPAGRSRANTPEQAAFRSALTLANRKIHDRIGTEPRLAGMGTTLTALLFRAKRVFLAHIGDSRAYLLRSGRLEQITRDHSVVADQVAAGLLSAAQARTSPLRHVITRALGIYADAEPDQADRAVQQSDVFLLCTDGLTEMIEGREIAAVLKKAPPAEAAQKLVDAANRAGGVDNITAVVVQVLEV